MKKTSPPHKIIFFAARDLQRNYFSFLSHHLYCPSKVVWYKNIWFPGLYGLKFLHQANLAHIVDLKLREKHNTPNKMKSGFYWSLYAWVRRLEATVLFLKYVRYLRNHPSEYVAVWNGNKFRQAVVIAATKCLNRRCAFFENGLLPNTTTLDFQGVNAFNSLPRKREFYDQLNFTDDINLPTQLVVRKPEGKKAVSAEQSPSQSTELPEPFIFVPFQIDTDSQITIHSPWIRNMTHLFELISRIQSQIHDKEMTFVFKEHPSSPQDYQYLRQRVQNNDHLMFANECSTQELIEKAEAIVTINSTVGLEALLLDKKVIALGNAFYAFEGLAKHAETEYELLELINDLEHWQTDEQLRENFLRYIQSEYAVPQSWTNPGEAHWLTINSIFECTEESDTHALYLVSTPLNLFIASAIAMEKRKHQNANQIRIELGFIDQPGDGANVYVETVKAWQDSPFDAIHVLPARTSGPLKKFSHRKQAFSMLREIIDELRPGMIAVGNDRRVEFQFAMHYAECSGYAPRGVYLDDGTYTYVGRKTKVVRDAWLDNGLKKLVYGRWWQQPPTVGASGWIDDAYVAFPELVFEPLKQKSLHKINASWFESQPIQSLSQLLMAKFEVDKSQLEKLDVVITLPHGSLITDESTYADTMRQVVEGLSQRSKRIGIKYHPSQKRKDPLGLAVYSGVMLLPSVLAFEVLLPALGEAVIVGDVSTALLSSKWLRPALRVIAIASGSYQQQFLELFRQLEIELIDNVSALNEKLQD
jgi:hypothetical protein